MTSKHTTGDMKKRKKYQHSEAFLMKKAVQWATQAMVDSQDKWLRDCLMYGTNVGQSR